MAILMCTCFKLPKGEKRGKKKERETEMQETILKWNHHLTPNNSSIQILCNSYNIHT